MSQTIIGINDPKTVKRFSAALFVDQAREGYWSNRFMAKGEAAQTPVQILTELENDAGDTISYDLSVQLKKKAVYGDTRLAGQEEQLKFYTDKVSIDLVRCGVSAGGKMTRKRVLHDLRNVARARMAEWWGRWTDEMLFSYGSGARGINPEFLEDADFTGFAGNAFQPPDVDHIVFGDGTSKATLTAAGIMTLNVIERVALKAQMMGGGTQEKPEIRPIRINGEDRHVLVMSPINEFDLRVNTSVGQFVDIQKAAAAAQGASNPLFRGSLGMYKGVILHSHKGVVRFADYGAGANLPATRSLFLGRQAMVFAYGSPGNGLRLDWHEETEDRGNEIVITSGKICGVKKSRFNDRDFGGVAVDTYANPQVSF